MMNNPPRNLVKFSPPGTVFFGGSVDKCTLSLRIFGDNLIPVEITKALGCAPSKSWQKDESPAPGKKICRTGAWILEAPENAAGDIDAQIAWIFSRLSGEISVWEKLTKNFRIDLFAGIFLEDKNRGFSISPKSLTIIAERGLKFGFDIYAPDSPSPLPARTPKPPSLKSP